MLLIVTAVGLLGALFGCALGAWYVARMVPKMQIKLEVTQQTLQASMVESWLDRHGLMAMPKGVDFRVDRRAA